jgi:endonuclease-3
VKQAEKAKKIAEILQEIFPSAAVPLVHRDPFTLLVAVMLSAQTTDRRVNQVTRELFKAAHTPEAMARLGVRRIEAIIRPLGLAPTKAKNLKTLSRQLLDEHGGKVPSDSRLLEALAGIGHKSAEVVRAQAFGIAAFPVDTHIHRLAARWGLSSGKKPAQTERDLRRIFTPEQWNRLHLQMIYFGREYCPARGHDLSRCRICSWAAPKFRADKEHSKTRRG